MFAAVVSVYILSQQPRWTGRASYVVLLDTQTLKMRTEMYSNLAESGFLQLLHIALQLIKGGLNFENEGNMRKIASHVVGELPGHKLSSTISNLLLAPVAVACVRWAWRRLKNDC